MFGGDSDGGNGIGTEVQLAQLDGGSTVQPTQTPDATTDGGTITDKSDGSTTAPKSDDTTARPGVPVPAPTPAPAPVASDGNQAANSIYRVQTLIDDQFTPNDNGWHLNINGDLTSDRNGPTTNGVRHYAYVTYGIRGSEAKSHWPKSYLDTMGLGGGTRIRYLAWNVLMDAAQAGNNAANTRVQFRNSRIHVLYRDGRWETVAYDALNRSPQEWGSWYAHFNGNPGTEPMRSAGTGSALHQGRIESSAMGGGSSLGSMGYGSYDAWAYHGWPVAFTKSQSELVNQVAGVVFVYEARLILHDAQGADDRAHANIMAWTGADWYNDSTGGRYIGEANHGRLKLVRNDWQIFSTHDLSADVLKNNPPPGFSR